MSAVFLCFCGAALIAALASSLLKSSHSPISAFLPAVLILVGASFLISPLSDALAKCTEWLGSVSSSISKVCLQLFIIGLFAEVTSLICEEISPAISKTVSSVGRCALALCAFPIVSETVSEALKLL